MISVRRRAPRPGTASQSQLLRRSRELAGGFFEQTAEFREQGRSGLGLEVAPGAFTTLFQNAAVDEGLELPLKARRGRSNELCQFGEKPPLVRCVSVAARTSPRTVGNSARKPAVLRIMRMLLRTTRKTASC